MTRADLFIDAHHLYPPGGGNMLHPLTDKTYAGPEALWQGLWLSLVTKMRRPD